MLWYKVWLETRARFLIPLAGMTALCVYRMSYLDHIAPRFYGAIFSTAQPLLGTMWLVAITLLMMGGLLQEKANGTASFTLALPVSRKRLMRVRICAGVAQAALLAIVPWMAMYAALCFYGGPARSLGEALFYVVMLLGGGAVFLGTAFLIASVVEGTYTAPMISAGIVLLFLNAPQSLASINPMNFMFGHSPGPKDLITGPIPWGHLAGYFTVAALLIAASVKVIERRDL